MRSGLGLVLAIALNHGAPAIFECDIWQGEGRPRLRASGPLDLHATPAREGAASRLTVPTSTDLVFDQVLTRTKTAVPVKVLRPTSMSGTRFGAVVRVLRDDYDGNHASRGHADVTAESHIEYLQYRAEGECFVRVDGVVWAVEDCPTRFKDTDAVQGEPVVEFWAGIVRQTRPAGWALVDGQHVRVVGRTF